MPKAPTSKEIRELFSDYSNEWKDIYAERKIDMRYVAGDPWDPADRRAREEAGRPCISLDEINQYLGQYIGNLRQNKRSIKVTPVGDGANDKDATRRANIIRGIEYRSNAQDAYTTAGEAAVQGSFGFAELTTTYAEDDGFNQELRIRRIANPETVILNPDYKEADASDITEAFKTTLYTKKAFRQEFGNKQQVSFTSEMTVEAPLWVRDNYIQVAKFWRLHKTPRKLLLVQTPEGPLPVFEDEMADFLAKVGETPGRGKDGKFAKLRNQLKPIQERMVEMKSVVEYLTNGIEILRETPWGGKRIPIISCFGKEIFVDQGGGSKRILMSMVRLMRDPQMLHAYYASQEAEEAGMSPKAPFVGYKGQFESDWEAWTNITKQPVPFVQTDVMVDGATGTVLPLPSRPQFQPNFSQYEEAKESARRSVQAASGGSTLPTAAQRQNEKSGVALEKIQSAQSIGSFQFADNYDRFLQNMGWQINELIPVIYDTARTVPVVKPDGSQATMRINDPQYEVQGQQGNETDHLQVVDEEGNPAGGYDVTISTGPNDDSQREAQNEFLEMLVKELPNLPVPPPIGMKILAKAIRMQSNLGVVATDIADLMDPPDESQLPPQAQAMVSQLQGQLQEAQAQLQELHLEKVGKVIEAKNKLDVTNIQEITKIVVAQLAAKSKADALEAQLDADRELSQLGMAHDAAHDAAKTRMEHEQSQDMATQEHVQGLEAGEQAHRQSQDLTAQQGNQQAALAEQSAGHQEKLAKTTAKLAPKPKAGK